MMTKEHHEKKSAAPDKQPSGEVEVKDARQIAAERAEAMLKQKQEEQGADRIGHSGGSLASGEEIEALKKRIEELTALRERWMRQAADFENAKKRFERERDEYARFSHRKLLAELLPVLRNLDRALHHAGNKHGVDDPLVTGVELVVKQIHQVLESYGVKRMETVGLPFDPNFHEALAHIPSEQPAETIIEEHDPGYLLHDQLLQPAKVIISKGPDAASSETSSDVPPISSRANDDTETT